MWCVTMVITALKGSYNSVVECCCHIAEVPGSNPGGSTENMKKNFFDNVLDNEIDVLYGIWYNNKIWVISSNG